MTAACPNPDRQHQPALMPALPQFMHIQRVWNEGFGLTVAKLLPGDYYVTRNEEMIFTVLGSCVSACVRERKLGIGGMNHFMLPMNHARGTDGWADTAVNFATRYGNVAMHRLVNDILNLGGERDNLEFKLVGGGKVLDIGLDVGARNAEFVRAYLKTEGFSASAEDLGESFARKVYYNPASGTMRVKRLSATANRTVFQRERDVDGARLASGSDQ